MNLTDRFKKYYTYQGFVYVNNNYQEVKDITDKVIWLSNVRTAAFTEKKAKIQAMEILKNKHPTYQYINLL